LRILDPRKIACQNTTITTHPTTNSPQIHHALHPISARNPSKNAPPPRPKKMAENQPPKSV